MKLYNPERNTLDQRGHVTRSKSFSTVIDRAGQQTVTNLVVPGEAQAYTVNFSYPNGTPLTSGGYAVGITGDVEWVVDGSRALRRVSVADGVSISGIANSVRVTTETTSQPVSPFTLSISISPGLRPNVQQPALFDLGTFLVPAGSGSPFIPGTLDIPFPTGIGVISFYSAGWINQNALPLGPNAMAIAQVQLSSHTILRSWDPYYPSFVPLQVSCTGLTVYNFTTNVTAISVSLGIDG